MEYDWDRAQRSFQREIFLIEFLKQVDDKGNVQPVWRIQGTTRGKIYNVYWEQAAEQPEQTFWCTCPDYEGRTEHCKHCYFVLQRVLRLNLDNVKDTADITSAVNAYVERAKTTTTTEKKVSLSVKIIPFEGEECSVCLDPMTKSDKLWLCATVCGKSIHLKCYTLCPTTKCPNCNQEPKKEKAKEDNDL